MYIIFIVLWAVLHLAVSSTLNVTTTSSKIAGNTSSVSNSNIKVKDVEVKKFPKYVFGYSTGHVGTTTYASESTYDNNLRHRNDILFLHENHAMDWDVWIKKDFESEFRWIKNDYWPWLEEKMARGKFSTFYDNGHHNLFFADGLMRYLSQYDLADESMFVRIRRHRVEAAVSLGFGKHFEKDTKPGDPAEDRKFSFHPFMREDDVILTVDKKIWNNLTPFQKGLWLVDETEERWKKLIKKYPKIPYKEVYFESEKGLSNYTIENSSSTFAEILGLKPHKNIKVIQKHAAVTKFGQEVTENKEKREKLRNEDLDYLKKTNYKPDWSYLPATYNSYDLPSEATDDHE